MTKRTTEPVGSEELKDAIRAMIVEKLGNCALDWETVERATALVNFEVKQVSLPPSLDHPR
jgi:hypothetical protein